MIFSAIGAGLTALAATLEPGLPTVETVVHAVCTLAAERPEDTNAVRVEPRVRVPRDGRGAELAAQAQSEVHLSAGLVVFWLSEADALRTAGRLRHEAHTKCVPGKVRVAVLLAAAKLHTAAVEASAAVAAARRAGA